MLIHFPALHTIPRNLFTSISSHIKKEHGSQKLDMVKIPRESNLLVTFSKRRYGIFKKASELTTLCGAEVTVIIFSPSMKVFSFGHPSVEAVIDRFLAGNPPQPSSCALQLIEAHRNARVRELNMQLTQVMNQLEMEKKRGQEPDKMRKVGAEQRWWESPIEELDLPRLEQLKAALEVLRQNVAKLDDRLLIQSTNHPYFYYSKLETGAFPFNLRNEGFNTNMMPYNFDLGFPSGSGFS
ncbi:hypothetical protein P3X46_013545 [Hevea brasiliensis]|uniref:MADS-box domain-containing protein n=1 Tax=Hevea brasiliensis TaxID=3981 RepID=A0ABQ9M3V4_HEVBR|nr:agamous-like MADS-box protein AGL62 [Hevea brasiliensis]KAJ9174952.1 hypothetical protein P3X46_013545 [Hevea brasiliensis]